jgi:twitching motility protein PilT
MDLITLLQQGKQKKASDLHLSAGIAPMLRINGDLTPIDNAATIGPQDVKEALTPYLSAEQLNQFENRSDVDFSFGIDTLDQRFRVNLFRQLHGTSAVLRYIPNTIPTLSGLNAPDVFKEIANQPNGLVLVTGPTGSGKSTTLAALINEINLTRPDHIVTIEDPIEFVHTSKKCVINQRQVSEHTESFSDALRSALREDPNIILVGELRDIETIRLALTAAETGHLVFATLHTSSASSTINRIIDVFPGNEKAMVRAMLSESLNSVIAQTLVKNDNGGRVAVHEIMRCTPAIRNLIREDKITQIYSAIQTGSSLGMMTKEQSLLRFKS